MYAVVTKRCLDDMQTKTISAYSHRMEIYPLILKHYKTVSAQKHNHAYTYCNISCFSTVMKVTLAPSNQSLIQQAGVPYLRYRRTD
ncbi:uncharacterized protein YALI1_D34916g [Yarrowia lipolytica]|uniref:Uncharacterized protein n=1 Tax=Yarrowia lipolytica TaxID=4952 RepID=A0A1D8NGE9_YARLL|nr:hypothetical protein YALI1_D34916g [Yarrowia lipolytica]